LKTKAIAVALIALTVTLTGCATIEPGERGVKVDMGVVDKHLITNGVTMYNPLTSSIYEYNVKQDTVTGEANPLTSDQQPISISYRVQYKIPEGQVLNLFENVKGDPYETLVVPQIQEAFRQVVSKYKADYVTANVNTVKDQVVAQVRNALNGQMTVIDIPITHVDLPKPLQIAIIEKQQMEMQAKKKAYELDRERKQAEITVTKAKAEAESTKLMTEALRQSPELVKFKMAEVELEKAKKWNGQLPSTVMGGNANTIFSLK
jgi:regulator of protease activity HflC (stomatin/prohibitin superfamily)